MVIKNCFYNGDQDEEVEEENEEDNKMTAEGGETDQEVNRFKLICYEKFSMTFCYFFDNIGGTLF